MMSDLATFPEFGNLADNANAFFIAVHAIENGEWERGMAILCALRQHIVQTDETKSRQWLLQDIAAAIMASATPAAFVRGQSTSALEEMGVRGLRGHSEWPQVADVVIEADIAALVHGES